MKTYLIRSIFCLLISALTFSCATKKIETRDLNQEIHDLVEQYKAGDKTVDYKTLWEAYLKSSQTESTAIKHQKYLDIKSKLDLGKLTCSQIDWDSLVKVNYWSINPHLSAANCKAKLGDTKGANFHESFVAMILEGVFSSGSGKAFYNAYEVASWGDVEDILNLAGYKSIDYYLELRAANQAVYYIVIAEDKETGIQQEIYFDNIRFLNSSMGYYGRLTAGEETIGYSLVKELANQTSHAAIALGDMLNAEKNYQLAAEWYLKASLYNSPVAYIKAATLCLKGRLPDYSDGACLEFVTKAAELEYAEAFILLSGLYQEGIWVNQDKQLAEQFLQIASEKKGKGKALEKLASFYQNEFFGEKYKSKADALISQSTKDNYISLIRVAQLGQMVFDDKLKSETINNSIKELKSYADRGNDIAQSFYGAKMLVQSFTKEESQQQVDIAISYLKKAAKSKIPYAQYMIGLAFKIGMGVEKDENRATNWFVKAANSWNPDAQYEVAKSLERKIRRTKIYGFVSPEETKKDEANAAKWLMSAAMQGHINSILALGNYFENGFGVDKSVERAAALYKLASDQKNKYGLYSYAYMLKNGLGVAQNYPEALKLFMLAQEKGHVGAANEIGLLYENGFGVEKNHQEALNWFTKAADKNHKWAQYNLGRFYENGLGVTINIDKAIEWYSKAAEQGHTEAQKRLKALK
ncbi:tetratricopeptide repeat protein [Aliikangiella sp. IMCC44359]|uniref:tetratricopeptide repeat protein n=1 Tax=Aliikangiella sp. IMCC44359 TaxID=3459125 RepID=UPI00403ABCCE